MKKINVIMIGVRSHYAIPLIMNQLGILNKLIIDFSYNENIILEKFLPKYIAKKLQNRRVPKSINDKTISLNSIGFIYATVISIIRKNETLAEICHYIYSCIIKIIVKNKIPNKTIIYAYEGGVSKRDGDYLLLEQTIVPYQYQKEVLEEEYKKWSSLNKINKFKKISWWLHTRREKLDWQLADKIICPSKFVSDALVSYGVDSAKIKIIEYGVDLDKFPTPQVRIKTKKEKLKIIFVGDLSLRKGALYLFECAKILSEKVEFNICGNIDLPESIIKKYRKYIKLNGRLNLNQLRNKLNDSHIFFLPSLAEGSAMSIIEASCSGLPVICTKSAGSRIRNNVDGLIMRENSVEAALDCINKYLQKEDLITIHSQNAINYRKELSIETYKKKIENLIVEIF